MAFGSLPLFSSSPSDEALRRTALVSGSVALGAYLTGTVFRWLRRSTYPGPDSVPPMLPGTVHSLELMEGEARYYERPGEGAPIVLLHSFNAAAGSHEMKPLFHHFTETTDRPVYALDWFGFGLSDRPPVDYRPELYRRQLRRFLSEVLTEPADLIALSLGCEYAAVVTDEVPFLVRRLALIAPTALGDEDESSLTRRALVGLASGIGAFELFFYRLTKRETLRRFYAEQVFQDGTDVPDDLVDYAFMTTHVRGAHHAPRRFVDGSLFLEEQARAAYVRLAKPALVITPVRPEGLVQRFERLGDVTAQNPNLRPQMLETGLMPHWDTPDVLAAELDAFLAS